jgi:hypothetical protein
MASIMGANHVFSEKLTDLIDTTSLSFQVDVVPKQEVKVAKTVSSVVYLDPTPVMVNVVDQIALVPESVSNVYAISKAKVSKTDDVIFKYIAVWTALHTHNSDLLWEAVNVLGDVHVFNLVQNAFTKQELQLVKQEVEKCILNKELQFIKGYKENIVPKDDAYTVLELLSDLQQYGASINRSTFDTYKAGTKKRETVSDQPKFEPHASEYVSANRLVYAEDRPNVSIGTTINGTVRIPLQKQKEFALPGLFDTFIHRNYTIVRDGVLNVKELIIESDDSLLELFDSKELVYTEYNNNIILDLSQLPLVNRKMVNNLNLSKFLKAKLAMLEY